MMGRVIILVCCTTLDNKNFQPMKSQVDITNSLRDMVQTNV